MQPSLHALGLNTMSTESLKQPPQYERLPYEHYDCVEKLARQLVQAYEHLELPNTPQARQQSWSIGEVAARIIKLRPDLRPHLRAFSHARAKLIPSPSSDVTSTCVFCTESVAVHEEPRKLKVCQSDVNSATSSQPICPNCWLLIRKFDENPRLFSHTLFGGCKCSHPSSTSLNGQLQHGCKDDFAAAGGMRCDFCRLVKMLSRSWMKRVTGKGL